METQKTEICRECSGKGYIRMDLDEILGETNRKKCGNCWGQGFISPDYDGDDVEEVA